MNYEQDHKYTEEERRQKAWIPIWIFGALAIGILGGFALRNFTQTRVGPPSSGKIGEVEEILNYVKERYVDSVDVGELEDVAIAQTLEELDPHSVYIPASDVSREFEQMTGEYEGIGIEFFIVDDTISVVSAISGGPAESVGIRSGDKIISVNDSTIAGVGITNEQVIKLLKGKKKTKVDVGIARSSMNQILDFTITRGEIPLNSLDVAYMLDEKNGYIKLNKFSQRTYKEFRIALEKLKRSGMENLVLDLRGNGGGILDDCIAILDEFIDGDKLLLSIEGRNYKRHEYHAMRKGSFEFGKLAILIDEGSASASEIVAGAIQDWDRGVIIGRRSFGKGLVQQSYGLKDGSNLRLTVARYYTPTGRSIQRSYDKGKDEYYQEWANRYSGGELLNADSVAIDTSLVKRTLIKKRPVYGGGGVIPDVFVPIDTANNSAFVNAVYLSSLVQQWAYDYYSDHTDLFNGYDNVEEFENRFFVTRDMYDNFIVFSREKLKDKVYTDLEVSQAKNRISQDILALLARQKFGAEGLYAVINDEDESILKAIETFEEDTYAQLF